MDQSSRRDESYHETHPGSLDPSHQSHPHPHPTLHRPNQGGVYYDSPQHGMFQQPYQQHGGFHQQNEFQHLREFSDSHDNAFSHHSYQQDRAGVSTLPNIPHAYGGSHPLAESQHSGGPQSGPHIDPNHHPHQADPRRPSEPLSHPHSTGTHQGTTHQQHFERSQHLNPQQNRDHYADTISYRSSTRSHRSTAPFSHQERPRLHADPHHEGRHEGHHEGHHAHSHHGEHPHHKEQRHYHGDHMQRHIHHHSPSASQLSHKSHSTVATSPSHVGSKSTASGARSNFGAHSHIFGKAQSRESLKESASLSEGEDHVQKRKKAQRAHKKAHTGNIFQLLWEKISHLLLGLQQMILSLTQSLGFETFIFIVVCLNTVILVAQTFTELEIRGDFFIMVMAVLDFVLLQINSLSYSFYNHSLFRILKVFKSMRALRAIRVLRRLSILTSLHEVAGTLSGSLPSITAILTLMFTCLFLFSVVLRALFQDSDPKRFQNIFTTLFTLFTMLTLDDWSLIYIDNRAQGAWYIIPILMIYIVIQYFIFLNLVIAVLVDNFQMALLKGLEKVKLEQAARVHEKLLDDSLTDLNKADTNAQMTEEALKMQLIEGMFGNMTVKQRMLHFQFLQLVAAVEQHQQKFRSQAYVIDELVDTAFEAGDDDYGK
ncbi:cation channel sperm-associated protein 1 isoform X2 [Mus caroli]|uniref:Cation channel sperm-associated protein 1 isoform X2 n=1 Tax=Mus caroli TaxID=10089 RepID=A0A6P5P1R4_MUSCR|nr:cation channel sperm-associated protein 1 isoform X2 [Mus caroli]